MGKGCGTGGRAGKGSSRTKAPPPALAATAKADLAVAVRETEIGRLRRVLKAEQAMTKLSSSKLQRAWRRVMPAEKVRLWAVKGKSFAR